MENIQRSLEKELAALSVPKSSRKSRKWTLLFIGDHGKIISIKRFKGFACLVIFLLLLAILSSGVLYYLYRETHHSNENLNRALNNIHRQVVSLRNEKDVLLVRLVVAESDLELLKQDTEKKQSRQSSEVAPKKPWSAEKKPEPAEPVTTSQLDIPAVVSVEDLEVTYELSSKTYRARFKLRNTGYNSGPISGYTAVVLRNKGMEPDKGLTLPKVKLVSGRPAGYKRGQYFSISRFKTVKFRTVHHSDPKQYNMATIFVFDSTKNLILEKNIPIKVAEILSAVNE